MTITNETKIPRRHSFNFALKGTKRYPTQVGMTKPLPFCPDELLVDDRIDMNFARFLEELENDCGFVTTISDNAEIELRLLPIDES